MNYVKSRRNGIKISLASRTGGLLRNFATAGDNELIFDVDRSKTARTKEASLQIDSPVAEAKELQRKAREITERERELEERARALEEREEALRLAAELAGGDDDTSQAPTADVAEPDAAPTARKTAAKKTAVKRASPSLTELA